MQNIFKKIIQTKEKYNISIVFDSRLIKKNDIFIGMKSFGASAPANELYKFFNITKEEIINKSKNLLK